jgi:hypothetical protein
LKDNNKKRIADTSRKMSYRNDFNLKNSSLYLEIIIIGPEMDQKWTRNPNKLSILENI